MDGFYPVYKSTYRLFLIGSKPDKKFPKSVKKSKTKDCTSIPLFEKWEINFECQSVDFILNFSFMYEVKTIGIKIVSLGSSQLGLKNSWDCNQSRSCNLDDNS